MAWVFVAYLHCWTAAAFQQRVKSSLYIEHSKLFGTEADLSRQMHTWAVRQSTAQSDRRVWNNLYFLKGQVAWRLQSLLFSIFFFLICLFPRAYSLSNFFFFVNSTNILSTKVALFIFCDFLLQLVVCLLVRSSSHISQCPGHCHLVNITAVAKSLCTNSFNACFLCSIVSCLLLTHNTWIST